MSTFDVRNDAPGLLRAESLNITLKFDRTSDSTGRISWNVPTPAAGCAAGSQAYNGMIVVIDTVAPSVHIKPTNTTIYEADNNVSENLFVGSKIGTAKVVGAFYGDTTTTYFDIQGLSPNTPYYVSGYPVDAQYRYYVEGVHAFSQNYKVGGSQDTSGYQVVVFNPDTPEGMGVKPSDATELTPGITYSFKAQVGYVYPGKTPKDVTECNDTAPTYTLSVNGSKSQTYQDLALEINKNVALIQGGVQSPTPPNTGAFFVNDGILYQWDGSQHIVYTPYINSTTQPNNQVVDTFWYNPDNKILNNWSGSPVSWNGVTYIASVIDPTRPTQNDTYWFNGTTGYVWNGATWCSSETYVQATDPSLPPTLDPATYWYNPDDTMLYVYDATVEMWNVVTAIQYHIDPNNLPTGTFWFNDATSSLYTYDATWQLLENAYISENAPDYPAPEMYWYNLSTDELFQRSIDNTTWLQLDVLTFPTDPTVRESCNLWWDTSTDELFIWDAVNSVWVLITSFYQQTVDPSLPATMHEGYLWYDGTDLYAWNGNCFKLVTKVLYWPTDPRNIANGTMWLNTTTNVWKQRVSPNWVDPTYPVLISVNDPYTPDPATAWYDPVNETLSIWNGLSWIVVSFSTQPYTPAIGTLWYDTTTNTLKSWDGAWIFATPFIVCELDCNGNFKFTDTSKGSNSCIRLTDVNLFEALKNDYKFHQYKIGADGATPGPTYEELGIGTDGSNDERLQLQKELRMDLGYPTIQVELTNEQLDYAIDVALGELRSRSGAAYRQGFFFIQVPHDTHTLYLTNKNKEHNKIVDVIGVYRATSSFLSSAHASGVYGQIVIQHLYNMGTFDLLSYHIMSEYTKLMEMLFAARVVFTFNEQKRELNLFNRFPYNENTVCVEASVERTEQEIMTDRRCRPWLRKYAGAMCRMILAESRGKFSTLPGAGGAVTLNASDLRTQAQAMIDQCLKDIEDQIVDNYQQYGMGGTFTFG